MLLLILAVLFVLFVVECVLVETEGFGWATATLVLTGIASVVCGHWFHTYSVLDFVRDHGVWTLAYLVGYVVVGVGWSFGKWFSYLMGFRDAFREQKTSFLKSKGLNVDAQVPVELQDEFKKFIYSNALGVSYEHRSQLQTLERPRASKNKGRITAWACYWPFSVVGTLLNDPVRRLFNFLFNQFKALYQRMADWVFRKDVELK